MVNRLDLQQARFSASNKIILLFIDGVGLGAEDPTINPCSSSATGIFNINTDLPKSGRGPRAAREAPRAIPPCRG